MSLISTANLQNLTDRLGDSFRRLQVHVGKLSDQAAPVAGTSQYGLQQMMSLITGTLNDYQQILDLAAAAENTFLACNAETLAPNYLQQIVSVVNAHCKARGGTVDASIVSLNTFLAYYNGGNGGSKFSAMLTPQFAALYVAMPGGKALSPAGVMSPCLHPTWDATVSSHGMGDKTVGGSFAAGTAVNTTLYSEVVPILEVTTDFADGSASPVITVAGTDDTGATSTTWSVTPSAHNPTAALSTTITPAVNAQARQTVAVGSLSGIVAGSVLTVNSGAPDQEVIIVEATNSGSTTITAVFQLAHTSGATLTGKNAYALTPSVSGRRCRSVSGITITLSSHDAGVVRVIGAQDRVCT